MYGNGNATTTARYVAERPTPRPSPDRTTTSTAPTTQLARALAMAGLSPKSPDRLWGALPVEEIEGHDVDPAYDVREVEGLGRAPIRSEQLAGLGQRRGGVERQERLELRTLGRPSSVVSAATGAVADPTMVMESSAAAPGSVDTLVAGGGLVPLAVLAGVLYFLGRR